MKWLAVVAAAMILAGTYAVRAAEHEPTQPTSAEATGHSTTAGGEMTKPRISDNPALVSPVVGIIGGLFAAALVIGTIVRLNTPQETAPAAGHDDSAHGGHNEHGHSGHTPAAHH